MKKFIKCNKCNRKFNVEKYSNVCPKCDSHIYNDPNEYRSEYENNNIKISKNKKKSKLIFLYNIILFFTKSLIIIKLILVFGNGILESSYNEEKILCELNTPIKTPSAEYIFKSVKDIEASEYDYSLSDNKKLISISCEIKNTNFTIDNIYLNEINIKSNNNEISKLVGVIYQMNNKLESHSTNEYPFVPIGRTLKLNLVYEVPLEAKGISINIDEVLGNTLISYEIEYLFM